MINKNGDLRTNTRSDGPNAVTWGVFPGKEIVQPTIVEAVSFMAWKVRVSMPSPCTETWCRPETDIVLQDEAYELGSQWAKVYGPDSPSYKLISEIMDTWYLVNVVHNDFQDRDAIFQPFFKAG